jgi:hypothetical protein
VEDTYHVGATFPVQGQVTVSGKALEMTTGKFGRVWFYPDVAKGNRCPQVAVGDIDKDGKYKLSMRDRDGAPAGWYKVMVTATEEIDPSRPGKKRKSFIHARYGGPETSKLAVRVVEEPRPGSYDLNLSIK